MRLTALFFLTFIISNFLFGQSTGYMGNRLQLSYAFNTSPALFGASSQNTTLIGDGGTAMTGEFALNMIHEGSLEFMPSGKWIIGAGVRYYKTAYDNPDEVSGYYATKYNGINYYSGYPSGYYTIKGLSYSLYFKYFGKRYVAPWGRYVMFGPILNTYKAYYDPSIMNLKVEGDYSYDKDTVISNFGPQGQSYKGFNILLGWGRSRVIANRVTVDYGCNFQLLSVLMTMFDLEGENFFLAGDSAPQYYIGNSIRGRVRGVNRFNVFLKVGVLLF